MKSPEAQRNLNALQSRWVPSLFTSGAAACAASRFTSQVLLTKGRHHLEQLRPCPPPDHRGRSQDELHLLSSLSPKEANARWLRVPGWWMWKRQRLGQWEPGDLGLLLLPLLGDCGQIACHLWGLVKCRKKGRLWGPSILVAFLCLWNGPASYSLSQPALK